ncbi:sulfatase [Stieleria sp. JC731]|uniref:sulfatase n=1 Tax=Pirellulaceae TaxID=2691357 RepID=UPI001E4B36FD|nr:sulfatase [Stieleria sp. JC731]MCC9603001.1 sulfatase [Stieleria sp. JC731]
MKTFAWLMALLASVLTTAANAADKPNILLICVDDLKPAIGCYGDAIAKTPNIDALAAKGVQFNAAYCNQAVCAPSRNALMTGLRPQSIGVYDLATNFRKGAPDAITMGQHFQAAGYRAESMGKIYHRGHGNSDDAATWSVKHWNPPGPAYQLEESRANPQKAGGKTRYAATERAEVSDDAYPDGKTADEAVKRIAAAAKRKDTPFFIAVGFVKPHLPFNAPEKYWELYDDVELPMPTVTTPPEGAPKYAPTNWGELRNYSDIPNKGDLSEATDQRLIHGYYAATSYMDAQVGRVLDELDRQKLRDNTIVVLWGDHGWHLGDHGMWCKHTNYEQAARIPLIISAPSRLGGQVQQSKALIESVDLYPTLSALAGLEPPAKVDGVDQSDVVLGKVNSVRDHVIHVYPRSNRIGRAIRTDRYRLVAWESNKRQDPDPTDYELYDYKADPLETKNLAASQPEAVASLKLLLEQHPQPKRSIAGKK